MEYVTNNQDVKEEESTPKPAASAPPKRQKPAEPNAFAVKNMTRVTHPQFPLLSFTENERYSPIRPIGENLTNNDRKNSTFACGTVVLLADKTEGKHEGRYIDLDESLWTLRVQGAGQPFAGAGAAAGATEGESQDMADPPEPFEYPFEDEA
jgi:hypothetical protein